MKLIAIIIPIFVLYTTSIIRRIYQQSDYFLQDGQNLTQEYAIDFEKQKEMKLSLVISFIEMSPFKLIPLTRFLIIFNLTKSLEIVTFNLSIQIKKFMISLKKRLIRQWKIKYWPDRYLESMEVY